MKMQGVLLKNYRKCQDYDSRALRKLHRLHARDALDAGVICQSEEEQVLWIEERLCLDILDLRQCI